jgi:hypothetical protein
MDSISAFLDLRDDRLVEAVFRILKNQYPSQDSFDSREEIRFFENPEELIRNLHEELQEVQRETMAKAFLTHLTQLDLEGDGLDCITVAVLSLVDPVLRYSSFKEEAAMWLKQAALDLRGRSRWHDGMVRINRAVLELGCQFPASYWKGLYDRWEDKVAGPVVTGLSRHGADQLFDWILEQPATKPLISALCTSLLRMYAAAPEIVGRRLSKLLSSSRGWLLGQHEQFETFLKGSGIELPELIPTRDRPGDPPSKAGRASGFSMFGSYSDGVLLKSAIHLGYAQLQVGGMLRDDLEESREMLAELETEMGD